MATNFSDTTPAAPTGYVNVKWQNDSSGNSSGYVPAASSGGSLPAWLAASPDAPPATAGSLDDEFLGASLDTGRWTWVNQGSVTSSQANSILRLYCPKASGDNKHCIVQTAPATPWESTMKLWFLAPGGTTYPIGGAVLRDSSGKLIAYDYEWTTGIRIARYNSPTSFNANTFNFSSPGYLSLPYYLKIKDDGTNLTYSYSMDGSAFLQLFQESRTAFLASGPTQVGLVLDANQTSFDVQLSCDWFRRTL